MRVVIIGLVFFAVILAGGTAYLLRDYLSTQQAEIAAQKPVAPTVEVLVAASDMPVGTAVNENNTEWIDWPEGQVPDGFLAREDGAEPLADISKDKHLARRGFTKGEPITMERLYKSDDPGFLRGALEPGMRAVAVRSSAEVGAGGFILPGDRVDMLLTHTMALNLMESNPDTADVVRGLGNASETILEDLRVLAVDQKTNEFEGGAAVAKTILLEVTPKQAEMINAAKAMGTLSLTLRAAEAGEERVGARFTTEVEVSPILSTMLGGGEPAPSKPAPAAAVPTYTPPTYTPPARPARSKKDITVYRGGQPGAAQ